MHIYNPGTPADLRSGDAFFTGSLFRGSHVLEHSVVLFTPMVRDGLVRFTDSSRGHRALLADEPICIFDGGTADRLDAGRVPTPRRRQHNRAIMRYERRRVRDLREGDFVIRANGFGVAPFSYHFTVGSRVRECDRHAHFLMLEEPLHGEPLLLDDIVHVHRRSDDSDIPRG